MYNFYPQRRPRRRYPRPSRGYMPVGPMQPMGPMVPVPPQGYPVGPMQGVPQQVQPVIPGQVARYRTPRPITKREFLDLARTRLAQQHMPVESIKIIDDSPVMVKHVCPKIAPIGGPIVQLRAQSFPEPMLADIRFYYCPRCHEFIYSWIA